MSELTIEQVRQVIEVTKMRDDVEYKLMDVDRFMEQYYFEHKAEIQKIEREYCENSDGKYIFNEERERIERCSQ